MSDQIGRYIVLGEVGRGGMATVYKARDPRFQRIVAVKVLPQQFMHDPMFLSRFEREAQTIAGLEHPGIVPVYDFGEDKGQPFLVMRFMPGGSLADQIIQQGALSVARALTVINKLAPALDYAHAQGIVHRDLKPGNILFDLQSNPHLADFGIVKIQEATTSFTGSAVLGTPAYMSPEQAQGGQVIDGRSDIYALGVILFEMLSGRAPYEADTPVQVLMKHILEPVPHVTAVKPDLSVAVDNVISRALAKEVDARYPNATAMAQSLSAAHETGENPFPVVQTEEIPQPEPNLQPLELDPQFPTTSNLNLDDSLARPHRPIWKWVLSIVLLLVLLSGGYAINRGDRSSSSIPTATESVGVALVASATPSRTVSITPTGSPSPTRILTSTPAPSLTSTASATPIPDNSSTPLPTLRINVPSTYLRNGPGAIYDPLELLWEDDVVTILARNKDSSWYNVQTEGGIVGWVAASVSDAVLTTTLRSISEAATIPAAPTRTPTNTPEPATYTPVPPAPPRRTNTPSAPEPITPTDTPTPCSYPYC